MLPITSGDKAYAVRIYYPGGSEITSGFSSFQWGISSSESVEPGTWYSSIQYSCPVQDAPSSIYYDEDYGMVPFYVTPSGCGTIIALGLTWVWVRYLNFEGKALITGDNSITPGAEVFYESIHFEGVDPPAPDTGDTGDTPTVISVTYTGSTSASYQSGSTHFQASASTAGVWTVVSSAPWVTVSGLTDTGLLTAEFDLVYTENTGSSRISQVWLDVEGRGGATGSTSFIFTQGEEPGPVSVTAITASVPSVIVDSGSASYSVSPEGAECEISWTSSDVSLATVTSGGSITVLGNGTVTFTVTDSLSGLHSSASASVRVSPPEPDNSPVWKDEVFVYSGDEYYDYNILVNGSRVYSGRNHIISGVDTGIYVNDIAKDFVSNRFVPDPGNWKPDNFTILLEVEVDGFVEGRYRFYKDYSYEHLAGSVVSLNDPIRNEVPQGCIIPFCALSIDGTAAGIPVTNGSNAGVLNVDSYSVGCFNAVAESGTYVCGDASYRTIPGCEKHVIYYENAFGGFDAFVPKWVRKKTDDITSYTLDQAYNNTTRQFENRRYLNIASPSWEFNTGWLTDEQSGKMHHLIESNEVYLYDGSRFIPVVMTDSRLEYRTWYNNGKKPVNYTISIKESWAKERR